MNADEFLRKSGFDPDTGQRLEEEGVEVSTEDEYEDDDTQEDLNAALVLLDRAQTLHFMMDSTQLRRTISVDLYHEMKKIDREIAKLLEQYDLSQL